METGRLSIVATPIGNLEDITLRALRTLREADVIFCEDTRVTGKLLSHYEIIGKELERADAEKEASAVEKVVALLAAGKHVAYVSDAGTPGVSDPGGRLVAGVRHAVPDAIIESIPGPSSLTAALSIAGLASTEFTFLGFVPHKKGRQTFFAALEHYHHPVVFFESTHRIMKTLMALQEQYPARRLSLGRELTKFHEEMRSGTAAELLATLEAAPEKQRGEFVVIFHQAVDSLDSDNLV